MLTLTRGSVASIIFRHLQGAWLHVWPCRLPIVVGKEGQAYGMDSSLPGLTFCIA